MPGASQLFVKLFFDVFRHILVVLKLAVVEHLAGFFADGDHLCLLVLKHVHEAVPRHDHVEVLLLRLSDFLRHFQFKYYKQSIHRLWGLGF